MTAFTRDQLYANEEQNERRKMKTKTDERSGDNHWMNRQKCKLRDNEGLLSHLNKACWESSNHGNLSSMPKAMNSRLRFGARVWIQTVSQAVHQVMILILCGSDRLDLFNDKADMMSFVLITTFEMKRNLKNLNNTMLILKWRRLYDEAFAVLLLR